MEPGDLLSLFPGGVSFCKREKRVEGKQVESLPAVQNMAIRTLLMQVLTGRPQVVIDNFPS